jgi:hypothetical protein
MATDSDETIQDPVFSVRAIPSLYDEDQPGVYLGHHVPGGYKYGDLALQLQGVSNETVKYGREFCTTLTQD